jgi:hypothetical protein
LAGNLTFIPEFHDCQRLILPGAPAKYGPLAAVWVSDHLAQLTDSLTVLNPAGLWHHTHGDSGWIQADTGGLAGLIEPANPSELKALPFAIIHAWNEGYPYLAIQRGWNCLYLYPAVAGVGYGAVMVPVSDQMACYDPKTVASLEGHALFVSIQVSPGLTESAYPPVGRWDMDEGRHMQYIGLKCGAAWCEVTPTQSFASSPRYGTAAFAASSPLAIVASVKGWYDEQTLALPSKAGAGLQPAPFKGIVMPDPKLDVIVSFPSDQWVHAGWAAIESRDSTYESKLGLARGDLPPAARPRGGTDIWLCKGDGCEFGTDLKPSCTAPSGERVWFARFDNLVTKHSTYRCVRRTGHENQVGHVWGTARWRWEPNDETLWFRCENGCCTTK